VVIVGVRLLYFVRSPDKISKRSHWLIDTCLGKTRKRLLLFLFGGAPPPFIWAVSGETDTKHGLRCCCVNPVFRSPPQLYVDDDRSWPFANYCCCCCCCCIRDVVSRLTLFFHGKKKWSCFQHFLLLRARKRTGGRHVPLCRVKISAQICSISLNKIFCEIFGWGMTLRIFVNSIPELHDFHNRFKPPESG